MEAIDAKRRHGRMEEWRCGRFCDKIRVESRAGVKK